MFIDVNAILKLQIAAGPKIHEKAYEAVFTWNGKSLPCSHGEIMRNPTLLNGFSPMVLVLVTVRDCLFGAGSARPSKGDDCTLKTLTETLVLQVGEFASGSGEVVHKLTLWDRNQNA